MVRPLRLSSLLLAGSAVALVLGLCAEALAQATGGSFGGGDWGGGGGGGGGGGYSGGSSHDDDGGGFILFQLVYLAFRIHPLFGLVVMVIAVGIFIARAASRNRGGGGQPSSWGGGSGGSGGAAPQPFMMTSAAPQAGSRAWMNADVTQIRIALDVAARPAIEEALSAMMRSIDVRSRHGLLLVVHRVAGLLRQHEQAWRLAGETNYHPMSPPQASGVFQQLAAAGRAKASASTSATRDPAGVFFVTLLVAAKREIVDFHAHRPEQIRMVLDDLARLGEHDLVAAEVYWLPLQHGTGMSLDEVRRMHPDMKHVEHAGGGAASVAGAFAPAAGFCPFCGKQRITTGPRCEHCGAESGGAIIQRG